MRTSSNSVPVALATLALVAAAAMPVHAQMQLQPVAMASAPEPVVAGPTANPFDEAPVARTRHVIVISIDGLRPDAIAEYEAPTLQRLVAEGSSSMRARTIFPSKTLPSHTSMLTGVTPEVHGILWNSFDDEAAEHVAAQTIFDVAHAAGHRTAAFAAKAKFRHLFRPESLDRYQAPTSNARNRMAPETVAEAIAYMRHDRPNLLFVHIGEPDFMGHTTGWMGGLYGWAVGQADAAVERLLDEADRTYGAGRYTVIVTADHGGHGHTHGTNHPEDRTIPWIAWGENVQGGQELLPGIRTMDTAATVLWLLGLRVPQDWAGRPVMAAFQAAPITPPALAAEMAAK